MTSISLQGYLTQKQVANWLSGQACIFFVAWSILGVLLLLLLLLILILMYAAKQQIIVFC